MDKYTLSPRLQDIISSKQEFFERYEAFIDFGELERLVERRGKLIMPELALHIVRVRGQKILDVAKTEAALAVMASSSEQTIKRMEDIYKLYEDAAAKRPELAKRYENMMSDLLNRLEEIPLQDFNSFRRRFNQQ